MTILSHKVTKCLNNFEIDFNSKEKWISGIVVEIIGSKLYKIRINGVVVIRHIDQIKRSFTHAESEADAWDFTVPLYSAVVPKRYPVRNRRPVQRYNGHW